MRVFGTVENARTEKPLADALVTLSIGNTEFVEDTPTTADGYFCFESESLESTEKGDILTCKVKKDGYFTRTVSHKIVNGEIELHVELTPHPVKWPRILLITGIILGILILLALIALGIHYFFFGPEPPPAVIKHFTAAPAAVAAGESSVLKWETENAVTVNLDQEKVDPDGSLTVTPDKTTEYILTVQGKDDRQFLRKVKVEVPPIPEILSFSASPSIINQWESTVLEWKTANADRLYITDGVELGRYEPEITGLEPGTEKEQPPGTGDQDLIPREIDLNGSVEVFPVEDTTYTITLINKAGVKVSGRLKVKVLRPPEIITFSASEPKITKGGSSILSWKTENAAEVYLGEERIAPVYSKEVSPEETTKYTLVVKNQVGERRKSVTVEVPQPDKPEPEPEPQKPPPPPGIDQFILEPITIAVGQTAVIHWVTHDASEVYLNGKRVEPLGTTEVFPQKDTPYTLRAVNPTQEVTWTRTIGVLPEACTVILYELENYRGAFMSFTTDAPEIGELNNAVSSIKLIGPCAVKVYSAPDFKATNQVFSQSIPRLRGTWIGNDTISSLRIVNRLGE